ncbi:MAG: ArdC family protein [Victivallales bacterium]|nr:ArdC family protein [Victivallales bacterium]
MKKSDKGREIFEGFDKKIKELEWKIESPETEKAIKDWLKFQSRFHNYSLHNTIWMMLQAAACKVEIEQVAPFKKWVEMTGDQGRKVTVNKGAKGFTVLFPYEHVSYECDEKGRFLLDEDGQRVPELDKDGNIRKIRRFGIGYVFDVKQTNAREIGAFKDLDHRGKIVEINADLVKEAAGRITEKYKIPVDFVKDPACAAGGWYDVRNKKIGVNIATCKNNAHRLGTLFHELGHAKTIDDSQNSRKLAEGKAEAFAYAACSAFGIERDSQLYIKHWVSDKYSLKEVMGDISRKVREVFNDLKLNELALEHSRECRRSQEHEQTAEMVA